MKVVETERLILREFSTHQAAFILALFNSPTWLQFIGDRSVRTIEEASRYIADNFVLSYQKYGFGFYMVELKEGHIPVGLCGLVKRDHLADVDIGFAFLPAYTGRGYAREAASACLDYAKNQLDMKRVVAATTPDNAQSLNLLTKLGLQFERMVPWPGSQEELMLFAINLTEDA
jgi:RimJ/RimL family protein N-acetyltransferase